MSYLLIKMRVFQMRMLFGI